MKLQNTLDAIAIPSEGIGLIPTDGIFEVDDALGFRLLQLPRFREMDQDGKPVPLLDPTARNDSKPEPAPAPKRASRKTDAPSKSKRPKAKPDTPANPEPGTIADPDAYAKAVAAGTIGTIPADQTEADDTKAE